MFAQCGGVVMSRASETDRAIVKSLIDSGAVNFEAIGATLAQFGPTAFFNLDYEDGFCGTIRRFVSVYRLPDPKVSQVADLAALRREVAGETEG
jgi:hypothetical protein